MSTTDPPELHVDNDDDHFEDSLQHDSSQHMSGRISSAPNVDNQLSGNNAISSSSNFSSNNTNENNTKNNKDAARCWELAYYQPYFDIDTSNELLRVRKALFPFTDEPFFKQHDKPDLYGPFWIVATLGFLMAAMSNLSRYLFEKQIDPTQWNSDIRKISEAFSFLYGGLVIIPGVTYFVLRSWNENPSLIELISLYGYSLISFVPTCIFCVLPLELVKWIGILTSCGLSLLFLTKNIYNPLPEQKKQKPGYYILGWLVVCQFALSGTLKFYFFKY